jgi:hypothetical protein
MVINMVLIDRKGKVAIPLNYDVVSEYKSGVAIVQLAGKVQLVNKMKLCC